MQHSSSVMAVDPGQEVVGYIVNSGVSKPAQRCIHQIQNKLSSAFPDAMWIVPPEALHITLMDWVAPLVDYGQNKDELFRSIQAEYIETLDDILQKQPTIRITFDAIEVHPAAIIVKGYDDGSYQAIRDGFLKKITLLPRTKRPPQIIHATICKFVKNIKLDNVKHLLRDESLFFEEDVTEFRLARESQIFLQRYEVLRKFQLK